MNVALRKSMTLAEFLAWEDRQELRHEFDGRHIVARPGGTVAHATIQANLAVALVGRLRGKPCRFFGSNPKFMTAGSTIRYPDGMVVCTGLNLKAKFVENPTVVFEVLSLETSFTDRIVKAGEYEATPSVQRHVMIEQDSRAAVVYARSDAAWTHAILVADAVVSLPEAGVEFSLAELYEGLDFAPPDEKPAHEP